MENNIKAEMIPEKIGGKITGNWIPSTEKFDVCFASGQRANLYRVTSGWRLALRADGKRWAAGLRDFETFEDAVAAVRGASLARVSA